MTYAEQLKHPKWQKRRLQILEKTDFKCSSCGSGEKTLHVHHKKYRNGAMAWEYEDHELEALCHECHEKEHGIAASPSTTTPHRIPSDDLIKHYIETWGAIAFDCQLVVAAKCRACGHEILCGGHFEGGEVSITQFGRGPKCATLRCGDKFPSVIVSYCESWQVLL